MFDASWFNTEYCVIGKTFAKPAGILSEKMVWLFFRTIEGGKNCWDFWHNSNGVVLEWTHEWNIIENIDRHTLFCIMPIDCVPAEILAARLARFDAMPVKRVESFHSGSAGWFDQHTQQHVSESDSAFEYRLIRTLTAILHMIQKNHPIKKSA